MDRLPEQWRLAVDLKYIDEKKGTLICPELDIAPTNFWQILTELKKLLVVTMLFMGIAITGFAQLAKVIALVNKASWCHVCQENGPRFQKDIMPMAMQNKNVKIVVNDLSNDNTKAASLPMLQKAGIENFASKNTGTGMLYLIDAKTKK
ncbi:hypothetical protein [Pedobacter sp. CG_S7]|uniref:hypothetical protein n=1 Tax=Pedobacter sp. CG_S7 TaxID=3143930 RepID=UPI00339A5560